MNRRNLKIKQVNKEIEKAQQAYDLNRAAELQYGRLPQLQKQLEEEETKIKPQLEPPLQELPQQP